LQQQEEGGKQINLLPLKPSALFFTLDLSLAASPSSPAAHSATAPLPHPTQAPSRGAFAPRPRLRLRLPAPLRGLPDRIRRLAVAAGPRGVPEPSFPRPLRCTSTPFPSPRQPPSRPRLSCCSPGRRGSPPAAAWWCGRTSRSYLPARPAAAGSPPASTSSPTPLPLPSAPKVGDFLLLCVYICLARLVILICSC
jgi:hypothetical protein